MKFASSALGLAAALAAFACLPAPAFAQQQAAAEARSPIRVFLDVDALASAHGTPVTRDQRADQNRRVDAIAAKRDQLAAIQTKMAEQSASLSPGEMASLNTDAVRLDNEINNDTRQLANDVEIQKSAQLSEVTQRIETTLEAYLAANPAIGVVEAMPAGADRVPVSERYNITSAISAMLEAGDNAAAPQGPTQPPVVRYAHIQMVASESGAINELDSDLADINDAAFTDQARLSGEIRQLIQGITPSTSADETQRVSALIQSLEAQLRDDAQQYARLSSERQAGYWVELQADLAAFVRTAPAFAHIDEIELIDLPGEFGQGALMFGDEAFNITDELAAAYKLKLAE